MTRKTLLGIIQQAKREGWEELDLSHKGLTQLPPQIGQLTKLKSLDLGAFDVDDERQNRLTRLPDEIGQMASLEELNVSRNELVSLPESIGQLTRLRVLALAGNRLAELPSTIGDLRNLKTLYLHRNKLKSLPKAIGKLSKLTDLRIFDNNLSVLPNEMSKLRHLHTFFWGTNPITSIPEWVGDFGGLENFDLYEMQLTSVPDWVFRLTNLRQLIISKNEFVALPESIGQLTNLERLALDSNKLSSLPLSLARLEKLSILELDGNPLNPALQSAYKHGTDAVLAYLRSLEEATPLYEAKLVLVGEGGVGKTTLLKALSGQEPRENEPTTHGVSIDIHSMHLPHPEKEGVNIQFNAWDFGGQEVYRITHQFFFSRRSVYLLVWEPRMGVQQGQVEDWLKLIRLRVGDDARVIIVSTHARTGQRIARIDKPVFLQEYGSMIVDFLEVDSLENDTATGEGFGIAALKNLIAQATKDLEHMGMPFNVQWKAARNELIELGQTQPRVSYADFAAVCSRHSLDETDTRVLAHLMHDLGYIVYYGDDERLKDDVVLQPEWLTKAIGFVLEDRATQEREGVLPDNHLEQVWLNHPFTNEPRYDPALYPFFLRLMEKYDVSYRLDDGKASLVAQHVPQVRPPLPWLPEDEPKPDMRLLAMVCVMEEVPPGIIPWMIVRTHDYAYDMAGHRLHWQKGMFLRNKRHGEAMLELRGREFNFHTQAVWPEYLMNILRQTLSKLIADNWPGMDGRYHFAVPCLHRVNGKLCRGRFEINVLRQFHEEGEKTFPCQVCRTRQDIAGLLFGFEDEEPREQLARIEGKLDLGFDTLQKEIDGLESRLANYVMAIMRAMANEAKEGPRLFDIQPVSGNWRRLFETRYRLRLWCEAEGCQHPALEEGRGVYEFKTTREWVRRVTPYASFMVSMLKTLVPMITPAMNVYFGAKTIENLGIGDHLDLMKEFTDALTTEFEISDPGRLRHGVLSEDERSGLLALHTLLRELDPQHARLGLRRVPTYTGDFLWLCETHYELSQPKIPEKIE